MSTRLFSILLLLLLFACSPSTPTTPLPTAVPPTAIAEAPTAVPPTAQPATLEPTVTATAVPTQEPTPVLPTSTLVPTPTPTIQPSPTAVPNGGITVTQYDHLASKILFQPGLSGASGVDSLDNYPDHTQLQLVGYPLPDRANGFHFTHIKVYPVPDYASINGYMAEDLETLAQILQKRPSIPLDPLSRFPFGPGVRTNVHYLDFANGSGVAYIAHASQLTIAINNAELFYVFVGLTNDGQRYISLNLPINHSGLPDTINYETFDTSFITANPDAYYNEIKTLLETSGDAAFTPPISSLDAFIQSFHIEPLPPLPAATQLTLDYPLTFGRAKIGRPLTIGGRSATNDIPVAAQLWGAGVLLAEGQTTPNSGQWSLTMNVLPNYTGPATLQLTQGSESITLSFLVIGRQSIEITSIPEITFSGKYVAATIYVEPINNTITIGLLAGCSHLVAQETINLDTVPVNTNPRIPIPSDFEVSNNDCLIAYLGQWGEENWTAAAVPISVRN